MITSLPKLDSSQVYLEVVGDLLKKKPISIEILGGGRNSRVFKVACRDGTVFAAKFYYRHSNDSRDRCAVEYRAFSFLWEQGVRKVPKPVVCNEEGTLGIYEFIVGDSFLDAISERDVNQAVAFLKGLYHLRNHENAKNLPVAAEASFSFEDIVKQVENRFQKLCSIEEKPNGLGEFLNLEFNPFLKDVVRDTGYDSSLFDKAIRTLSPSDFGFHNALKRANGEIVFLDFEYFGWDDPAKMIVDFLLHPAMKLSENLKQKFLKEMLVSFADDPRLKKRVQKVYPLFGMKWCMILLNEFLPDQYLRRHFASTEGVDRETVLKNQLEKARKMLMAVRESYENS